MFLLLVVLFLMKVMFFTSRVLILECFEKIGLILLGLRGLLGLEEERCKGL